MSALWLLLIVPAAVALGRAWQTVRDGAPWRTGFRAGYTLGRKVTADVDDAMIALELEAMNLEAMDDLERFELDDEAGR